MNAVIFLASIGFLLPFAAHVFAFRRFSRRIQVRTEALRSSPPARWRDDLPPPVAAFARRCGAGAQDRSSPSAARFSQRADLRLAQGAPFHPIRAEQHVALGGAGFAWDASRWIGPFRSFRVIDAYDSVLGGMLEARLLGSLAVASKSGSDIALGEALRYLAELPWAPDAILGNPAIAWRITGDRSAEAALSLPEGTARVSFGFDEAGDIETVEAKDRPAFDARGRAARYDWRGRFWGYRRIGPRRIPEWGEVGYVYPEGYEVYFRGRILSYELIV